MKLFILILLSSCSTYKTKLKDIPYLTNSIGNEVKYGEFRDDICKGFTEPDCKEFFLETLPFYLSAYYSVHERDIRDLCRKIRMQFVCATPKGVEDAVRSLYSER